jgi:hypothetical protein
MVVVSPEDGVRKAGKIFLLLMGVLVAYVFVKKWSSPAETLFRGRTVNEWIRLLPDNYDLSKVGDDPADVLSEVGADAVPGLILALRQTDSKPRMAVITVLNELPGVPIRYVPARNRYLGAQMAFHPQKATAQAAVPQLADMLTQPDVEARSLPDWAANQLAAIGEPALPELINRTGGTNIQQRMAVIGVLGTFECRGWTENHHMIRDYMPGYHAPFQIQPESGAKIIRTLQGLLHDSDSAVRSAATNALIMFQRNNSLRQEHDRT